MLQIIHMDKVLRSRCLNFKLDLILLNDLFRRLQRHVERSHLGNFNQRKYEKKLLLKKLVRK